MRLEEYNSRAILRRCHPTCVSQVQVFLQKFLQTRAFFFFYLFFFFFSKTGYPRTRVEMNFGRSRGFFAHHVERTRVADELKGERSQRDERGLRNRGEPRHAGRPAGKTSEHQAGVSRPRISTRIRTGLMIRPTKESRR